MKVSIRRQQASVSDQRHKLIRSTQKRDEIHETEKTKQNKAGQPVAVRDIPASAPIRRQCVERR